MRILVYGSLNFDLIYQMDHFVQAGETESSLSFQRNFGGKGFNVALAARRAGGDVAMAGKVGYDGQPFLDALQKEGIDTKGMILDESVPTGHAVIQVAHGENCIVLFGGANQQIEKAEIDQTLQNYSAGDVLVLQNEINNVGYLIQKGKEKGMTIAFNASPMNEKIFTYPLDLVDLFFLNENEGKILAGGDDVCELLMQKYPHAGIVYTLGENGASFCKDGKITHVDAYKVPVVDTTGAGDTFTGYFLVNNQAMDIEEVLKKASLASSLAIQKSGVYNAIPTVKELDSALQNEHNA